MASIRDDTIGGFNTFLKSQKHEPGTATLTLVQFDSQDPYEVIHRFKPIGEVPELTRETYVPRAATPLLDALGRGIIDIEKGIEELTDSDRPSKVVVVVVTDGRENASREFGRDQIEKMVNDKTEKDAWQFVFLSADLAAIEDAQSVGIHANATLLFEKTGQGTAGAWAALSEQTCDYRSVRKNTIGFKKDDRKHPCGPERQKTRP